METKVCKKCNVEKNINNFTNHIDKRDGRKYFKLSCKECCRFVGRQLENKIKRQKYYLANRVNILSQKKKYNQENKIEKMSKRKIYYRNNRDRIIAKNSSYKREHREQINKKIKERRKNDPIFKIREAIRSSVKVALRRLKNGKSINKYLPYSIIELKQHLESQFESWISWNNWGKYNSKNWNDQDPTTWTWQLDHIIPQSDLPYTSMLDENFKKCWSLDNLRPYSAKQNIIDGGSKIRRKVAV